MMETNKVPKLDIFTDYHVLRVLGEGGEGTVYVVEEKERSSKHLLKVFHNPRTSDWLPGLVAYADKVKANDFGLPEVKLLFNGDKLIGVVYPYVHLYSLHWRILKSSEKIAQSIIGSYCLKQYYLMTEYGLALYDPPLPNFMVDRFGQWHYSDVGGGICPLNHPYVLKHGLMGYGFASLLLSIYQKTLHHLMLPVEDYSYEEPCIYCNNEWLDPIASQHEWVKDILSDVHSHKPTIFHDPEFYRQLSERLPGRVPWPELILPVSKILIRLGKIKGRLGLSPNRS